MTSFLKHGRTNVCPESRVGVLLVSLVLMLSCSSQNKSTEHENGSEAKILEQLELKALSAELRLDTGAIGQSMHVDFVAIYPHKLQNKHEELAGIYRGRVKAQEEGITVDSLYLDDFRARFYNGGNTAVLTFYTVSRGSEKDTPCENLRWRWYDVWVKEYGAWKLVSMQGTPLN